MESAAEKAGLAMEPVGLELRYVDEGIVCSERRDVFGPFEDEAVLLDATFDGEVVEIALKARRPIALELLRLRLRHAFTGDEMVLLNGYQSWTDTRERPAWARMRGLSGVPAAVVDRWALGASGDYAFTEYSKRYGDQHGFTYATFRRGDEAVLVGSLDESRGFTLVRTSAGSGLVTLETEPPARELAAGQRVVAGRYAICCGTLDECYDRWFALAGVSPRPAAPLVGYTSWYRHYGDIDEAKLLHDLAGMCEEANAAALMRGEAADEGGAPGGGAPDGGMPGGGASASGAAAPGCWSAEPAGEAAGPAAFASSGSLDAGLENPSPGAARGAEMTRLFQIDDGYCKVGDWLEVDAGKFPHGMKPLADEARAAGFLPGLWVAPFVCERDSRIFRECDDWLLRDEAGDPVRSGPQWSGGYALDTRNVEVRSYVLDVLSTMTREWGFALLKADFLYAACMRPHDGLNRGELMADAMGLLRRGAGEDALILGCGVPLGSAFGRVEYCRIGCDVGLDWDDKPHMRALHRERVSTKRSLENTYGRAPLDGRAFGNDPDVFFLRGDVALAQSQRDELLFADADLGSVLLTSDDMGAWDKEARARYGQALRVFREHHARHAKGTR